MLGPHRRVAVLDRPLRRARRRHGPHPRRAVHQLLEDATVDTDRAARSARCSPCSAVDPPDDAASRRVVGHRARRLLRRPAGRPSSRPSRGAGERPRRPRGGLRRDVGMPQRHVQRRARAPAYARWWARTRSSPYVEEPGGDVLRARRLDHEPRRRAGGSCVLGRCRRAGRHDRPAARLVREVSGRMSATGSPRCCARPAPRTRTCAPTAARSTRRAGRRVPPAGPYFPRSVLHACGVAETLPIELDAPADGPHGASARPGACWAGPAASWSSCGADELLDDLPARWSGLQETSRRRRGVSLAALPRAPGWRRPP